MSNLNDTAIDPFFNTAEFAVAATYTPSGGQAASINVLFIEPGTTLNIGGEEVITTAPIAICKTSEVSTAGHGATLLISGTTYYVMIPLPGGTGLTNLALSEDAT